MTRAAGDGRDNGSSEHTFDFSLFFELFVSRKVTEARTFGRLGTLRTNVVRGR
jgi:hypothetical protein